MDEFGFIQTYLKPLAGPGGLGLLDDAALLTPPKGCDLVLTKDAMVEGVHFPNGHYGGDTAEKLLRVNLSDLAAKGARPLGYLLSIAWPETVDPKWMDGFAKGLSDVQSAFDFALLGGDTVSTKGPFIVSATFIGAVPKGDMVQRTGAKVGDDVWLTGTIGDAFLGLQIALGRPVQPGASGEALWLWENAYYRPEPRLLLRKILRKYASAAMDVSDGLVADAGHLAKASGVQISFHLDDIPISGPTQTWVDGQPNPEQARVTLATAGDDYEILFTASPKHRAELQNAGADLNAKMTLLGSCLKGEGVQALQGSGEVLNISRSGYNHFPDQSG